MTAEADLLARAAAFDAEALTAIHRAHYAPVFRYLVVRVGDRALAEDLAGDVFLRFLDALKAGRPPQRTLAGWLYGTAAHVIAEHRRRIGRHPETALEPTRAGDDPDPGALAEAAVTWDAVHTALEALTEEQKDVVALRFGYGLPIDEVAEALGKSSGAVKQLQARAIAQLARRLEPLGSGS